MPSSRRVLIVLPQWVHIMDVAGPAQVFVTGDEVVGGGPGGASGPGRSGYAVSYVGVDRAVTSHHGLMLTADAIWPRLHPRDLVLVPGWKTTRDPRPLPEAMLAGLREHADRGGHVASVCAGSLLLAQAGLLGGRPATTHHELTQELARYPGVRVQRDVLYTCAPRLHTSAGIASGIDLALHLVAHDHGPAIAARVARTLVVPAWRPGAAAQHSVRLAHRDHLNDLAHRAQDLLDNPEEAPLGLGQLAARLGVSDRTLARHFTRAVGMTPHAYATAVRRERAGELLAHGWTQEAAAAAVGYADGRSLRRGGAPPTDDGGGDGARA